MYSQTTPPNDLYAKYEPLTHNGDNDDDYIRNPNPDNFWWLILKAICVVYISTMLYSYYMGANSGYLGKYPDANGAFCGIDDPVKGLPYVYYPLNPAFNTPKLMMHHGICVSKCPDVDDVGKPIPVRLSQIQNDSLNKSNVQVKYTIHSPQYATEVQKSSICFPMDETLKKDVIIMNFNWLQQMKDLIHNINYYYLIKDVLIFTGVTTLIYYIILPTLPRLSIYIFTSSSLVITAALCMYIFYVFSMDSATWNNYFAISQTITVTYALGCFCCLLTLFIFFYLMFSILLNWGIIWEGISVYKACLSVLHDLSTINQTLPILLCILNFFAVWIGIKSWIFVISTPFNVFNGDSSYSVNELYTDSLSELKNDGGWLLKFGLLVYVDMFSYILIKLLQAVSAFVGTYMGVVWYYSAPLNCGCDQRDISLMETVRALNGAFDISIGTCFLWTLLDICLSPVCFLFNFMSRRKCPNFTPSDGDHLSDAYVTNTLGEMNELARSVNDSFLWNVGPSLAAFNDFFHNASLTEHILHGSDIIPSMAIARKKMVQRNQLNYPPSASRYISSFTLMIELISHFVATFGALYNFSNYKNSLEFINSCSTSMIVYIILYSQSRIIGSYLSAVIDSILYCYITDLHSYSAMKDKTEYPILIDRAPSSVKLLLMKLLSDELGVIFDTNIDEIYLNNKKDVFCDGGKSNQNMMYFDIES